MIDVASAGQLLDFASRIGAGQRAEEQLHGAVAVHNLLERNRVAYLADEVGMGKTYVALGAVALFRHFRPDFRLLVIAPRENIQEKWRKEFRNFVRHNVRYPDLRVKALDGQPARPLVSCRNLLELVREACVNSHRDFFTRLTSFSLPLGSEGDDSFASHRDELRRHLPWLDKSLFDLRGNDKEAFKNNFARAVCCALPKFDLVIVDEAHNLKRGGRGDVSARNRVLNLAMGHSDAWVDLKQFRNYGPRAERVLFLSATPVEETYRHLWNQLDLFGRGGPFPALCDAAAEEEAQKEAAGKFLVRRVTSIRVGGAEHTKNLYRREWRRGGVRQHDEPIRITDARQRLVVALVQKKVSELLGDERFGSRFQIGMLASFESFLETSRLKRDDTEAATFDDTEQTDDRHEREGIDVRDVNRIARDYRTRFEKEMSHPKMDALVDELERAWVRGEKSLVFVRRVASVNELKRKLDERYDAWLRGRMLRDLPEAMCGELDELFQRYRQERDGKSRRPVESPEPADEVEDVDHGGNDTFFAWFFRGKGPGQMASGAHVRLLFRRGVYSTFFEDNYAAEVLGCRPDEVAERLAAVLGIEPDQLLRELQERSARFIGHVKRPTGADRLEAVQAAVVDWLKDCPGPHQEKARAIWQARFATLSRSPGNAATRIAHVGEWLERSTFFTELRQRPELRKRLWPATDDFRQAELRAQLLSSAARLGHAFIDLYMLTVRHQNSFQLGRPDEADGPSLRRIREYLDLLDRQRTTPLAEREWGAFDELADLSENYELILDVNASEVREPSRTRGEVASHLGQLLGRQQPVAGMSGQVNFTLVRQFRMPGYPVVMLTTDLLQEGEDLHTFCSRVHHYGIAWTPSAMEQRIGRIDRVRSHTDRRLAGLTGELSPDGKLQVYFPHLEDTVEVLQVQRVLDRMNVFLRLMHSGLTTHGAEEGTLNAAAEFVRSRPLAPQHAGVLQSAFPVRPEFLQADPKPVQVVPEFAAGLKARFAALRTAGLRVTWEDPPGEAQLFGTAEVGNRKQPFTLLLGSVGAWPLVRCVSPVGRVEPGAVADKIRVLVAKRPAVKLGAILEADGRTYDLTAEADCLLAASAESDAPRVARLIDRVVREADKLEQVLLPGKDEPLKTFRTDLGEEGEHDE